ncbi:flagellar biosynthetic protein FliO [Aquincola sp. S2]|uniref:Flagellar protein n=1 Tax=Pseudaquabacterium terrae TaxID=2732868 RepID=A0ABX2EIN8_9BURK|nr:flagellar biosynthetic protein FliO [Aquabacterium terrae]NRF68507.1 flagellar biosynthetic protein FliO [Aquabacterium terrae]
MTGGSILGPLAAFVAILVLIPVALWLLKRTPIGAAASQGPMRLVAALPLGPNQRLLTVEVGAGEERRWLVLGVTPGGINTLHTMGPQADLPAASTAALPFAQFLNRARGAAPIAPKGDDGAH